MPYGTPTTVVERLSPHTISLRRGNTTLAAQQCRIDLHGGGERFSSGGERFGAGATSRLGGWVFGTPDLDILRGDLFAHAGIQYRVAQVEPVSRGQIDGPTMIVAYVEALQA